jgi:putative hydrolase of the HAD superfamily
MADPKAILFDLDDTLISAYGNPEAAWARIAAEFSDELHPRRDELVDAILAAGRDYWADSERSRKGRLAIDSARRVIVGTAFDRLGLPRRAVLDSDLVERMATRFGQMREEQMQLFDDAHPVLDEIRRRGIAVGLVTNGASAAQRGKLQRFDLAHRLDHVQIEEEAGFGKPDARAFMHTLTALGAAPAEAWMVGDNFEADMVTPAALGLRTYWVNRDSRPLPRADVRPSDIVERLTTILEALA